jgi:hypothetical protein
MDAMPFAVPSVPAGGATQVRQYVCSCATFRDEDARVTLVEDRRRDRPHAGPCSFAVPPAASRRPRVIVDARRPDRLGRRVRAPRVSVARRAERAPLRASPIPQRGSKAASAARPRPASHPARGHDHQGHSSDELYLHGRLEMHGSASLPRRPGVVRRRRPRGDTNGNVASVRRGRRSTRRRSRCTSRLAAAAWPRSPYLAPGHLDPVVSVEDRRAGRAEQQCRTGRTHAH